MEINWLEKKHAGRSSNSGGVYISHTTGGGEKATYVRLGVDVLKHCRFLIGDRVLIGEAITPSGVVLAIRRDPSGRGYTLSSGAGKRHYGKNTAVATIKMRGSLFVARCVSLDQCTLREDGTLIIPLYGAR